MHDRFRDRLDLAPVWVVAAALAERAMREALHRISVEVTPLTVLTGLVVGTLVLAFALAFRAGKWNCFAKRVLFVCATLAFTHYVIDGFDLTQAGAWRNLLSQQAFNVVFVVGLACAVFMSDPRWHALRRALWVGAVCFVAVQPVFAYWRAPQVSWPPGAAAQQVRSKDLTVVVLFDELNSRAGERVAEAFRAQGLLADWKAVRSIGDATAHVVPGLFLERDFKRGKPCGWAALCSDGNVLRFDQIVASRPDVDVLGFFLPYCDIEGLRWCKRDKVPLHLFNPARWRCDIARKLKLTMSSEEHFACDTAYRKDWNSMVDAMEREINEAPAWNQGGLLFMHLPIPHPPGPVQQGSLAANYLAGLERMIKIVETMVRLSRAAGQAQRNVTFIVFSDHPLRQSEWCDRQWIFNSLGCVHDTALDDPMVPIVVAGDKRPALDAVISNGHIFELARHVNSP